MLRGLLTLLMLTGYSAPALAYRPLTTENAGVVGLKKFQLESSWDRMRMQEREDHDDFLLVTSYGLTERTEAAALVPYSLIKPPQEARRGGIGDVSFYCKHAVIKEGDRMPALTGEVFWRTDSGDTGRGFGAGYRELGLLGVASKSVGRLQANVMAGEGWAFGGGDAFGDAFEYGASLDWRLTKAQERPFFLLSEIVGGENPEKGLERWRATWFWGLIFEPTPRFALDIGIGWGLDPASPHWRTTLGSTFIF